MNEPFTELMDSLQAAKAALSDEMRPLASQSIDSEAGLRLLRSVQSMSAQAGSLLVMAEDRRAEASIIKEVEGLIDYFWDVEQQLEAILG